MISQQRLQAPRNYRYSILQLLHYSLFSLLLFYCVFLHVMVIQNTLAIIIYNSVNEEWLDYT